MRELIKEPDTLTDVLNKIDEKDRMSDLERVELADRMKGMSDEEKKLAVKLFPSNILIEEIARRNMEAEKMISDVRKLLRVKE